MLGQSVEANNVWMADLDYHFDQTDAERFLLNFRQHQICPQKHNHISFVFAHHKYRQGITSLQVFPKMHHRMILFPGRFDYFDMLFSNDINLSLGTLYEFHMSQHQ